MATLNYDLVVIGGGSGGLTAARVAAELGVRTALVEQQRLGGDCLWTGCVPSKALLKASKVAHAVRSAAAFGVEGNVAPAVDLQQVMHWVRTAQTGIAPRDSAQEQGRYDEAKLLLKKALYLVPSAPASYLELGELYRRESDTARARTMYLTALELLEQRPAEAAVGSFGGPTVHEWILYLKQLLAEGE